MKKFLAILLSFLILTPNVSLCAIKGHIEENDSIKEELNKELFSGKYEVLKEDKTINMTVSQVLSSGYTQVGDEFFAEISQNVEVGSGVVLPVGSVIHGIVNVIAEPKRMGRDGFVMLDFDYIITPDGRQVPIKGSVSTRDSAPKAIVKGVAEHTGYTIAGGAVGAFVALNLFGLEAAIASQGYTIAGGAAIGGALGLISAMRRKGDSVLIKPGDELKIKMMSDIELPVFSQNAFLQEEVSYKGLDVKIVDVKYKKDPFGEENTIALDLVIKNNSDKTFSTFDIALVSDTKGIFHPSPFGTDDSLFFKNIKPGDRAIGELTFSVNDRKRNHWLVFYDKVTRKPLAKFSVDNARNALRKEKKSKKRS